MIKILPCIVLDKYVYFTFCSIRKCSAHKGRKYVEKFQSESKPFFLWIQMSIKLWCHQISKVGCIISLVGEIDLNNQIISSSYNDICKNLNNFWRLIKRMCLGIGQWPIRHCIRLNVIKDCLFLLHFMHLYCIFKKGS